LSKFEFVENSKKHVENKILISCTWCNQYRYSCKTKCKRICRSPRKSI